MKTKLELQEQRSDLVNANVTLLTNAKNETRSMSDSEQKKAGENSEAIKEIDSKIEALEKELRKETEQVNGKTKNEMKTEKRFNLLTAIRNQVEGRKFSDHELSVINAGKEEMRKSGISAGGQIVLGTEERAINVGTATEGQEIVPEQKSNILAPLKEALVLAQAGATFLTGLTGNFSIPAYAGTTAGWKGEVAAADNGEGAFSEVDFAPLRLTAYVDISKLFLQQDSVSAEAMLKQDIVNAVAGKLQQTILSEDAAVAGVSPAGIFAGGDPSINGVASWANVVAMETAVDTANALAGNISYIMGAPSRGIYKTAAKDAGSGLFLMDSNNTMNGYPVHVTNSMVSGMQTGLDEYGVAFANWGDLVIAQWGGVDLTIDPYTLAKDGQVRLVVNAYFDAKFRRTASVSLASVK